MQRTVTFTLSCTLHTLIICSEGAEARKRLEARKQLGGRGQIEIEVPPPMFSVKQGNSRRLEGACFRLGPPVWGAGEAGLQAQRRIVRQLGKGRGQQRRKQVHQGTSSPVGRGGGQMAELGPGKYLASSVRRTASIQRACSDGAAFLERRSDKQLNFVFGAMFRFRIR
jgi:hypothetical protein